MNKATVALSDVIDIQLDFPSQQALTMIAKLQDLNGVCLLVLSPTHVKVFLPFYVIKSRLAIEIASLLNERLRDIGLLTQLSTEIHLAEYGE
jgi:hypothetical protein